MIKLILVDKTILWTKTILGDEILFKIFLPRWHRRRRAGTTLNSAPSEAAAHNKTDYLDRRQFDN
jgi:hypothetical protein